MANVVQFDLKPKGEESRVRALLEDLAEYHTGVYPQNRLALAVWFAKSPEGQDQNVLELFSGPPNAGIVDSHFSLLWKTGSQSPPYINLRATSVDYFSKLLKEHPGEVAPFQKNFEVLYFDKKLLNQEILEAFQVTTEPPGLMKGWYVTESEYANSKNVQGLLSLHAHAQPHFGLVKTQESPDFENCRGVLHVEVSQRWLPFRPEGLQVYTYFTDQQKGNPVYFLFEGGSLYRVLKFEVRTAPEYAGRFLERTPNDRYPEVYLRAVHPTAKPAA
jgi:hypothetical protein